MSWIAADEKTAKLVYVLYLLGVVLGLTAIVGVVLAHVCKDDAEDWLRSHFEFQIRTFWLGLLFLLLAGLLLPLRIGLVVPVIWAIWLVVRCLKGFRLLERRSRHPDPQGWLL